MFPGSSCYPMSPTESQTSNSDKNKDQGVIGNNDQIIKILELLPRLTHDDVNFISEESTL